MQFKLSTPKTLIGAAIALTALSGHAVTLVGITSSNELALIDTSNIAAATSTAITGLAAGERFVSIDLRPTTNTIYGISQQNNIYTLNQTTGAATFVKALSTAIIDPSLGYGFDFNPLADFNGATSGRLISSAGQNFAVNVTSGVVAFTGTTGSLVGLSAASYTNSVPLATVAPAAPTLYYINSNDNKMYEADPPNFNVPTITEVGKLFPDVPDVDVLKANGFEIFADGSAYAAFNVDDASLVTGIYSLDIETGAATKLGEFNGTLSGLTAAVPEPETYALLLAGLGVVGFVAKRRKSV